MTNNKWLSFAGLLNGCIYQLDHPDCPFKECMEMDQYQRLKFLLTISDSEADKMMKSCLMYHKNCKPILIEKQETTWDLSLIA